MGTRPGTLLERDIQKIFKLAGFTTHHQAKIKGYEIDVLAETDKGLRIIIECKQYENAQIEVRNLIHQWDSKNKEIQANKILLVIYGINITHSEKSLAHKLGITIWDKKDVEDYLDYVIEYKENAKQHILNKLEIAGKNLKKTSTTKSVNKETDKELIARRIREGRPLHPIEIWRMETPESKKKITTKLSMVGYSLLYVFQAIVNERKPPQTSTEDKRLLHRGNQESLRELSEDAALDIKILRDECTEAIENLKKDKDYEQKAAQIKQQYANQIRQIIQQHTE